jgi:hypothetical protein
MNYKVKQKGFLKVLWLLPVLWIRIRTFLVGYGSGRLGPDPDPGLNKWL